MFILIQDENKKKSSMKIHLDLTYGLLFGWKQQTGTTPVMKIIHVTHEVEKCSVLYCCINDVISMVSELCQSRRMRIVPPQSVHSLCSEQESVAAFWESVENTENLQIQFSHFPSDWSKITQILQNCNKSLYNELHHISTTSLAGFSTSSNQNPNLHEVLKFYVKRGCRTNKIQCSKSLSVLREAGKTGEKDRKGRQTERALIKHDCMIFQPQRGKRRKAHSQSSS